MSILILLSALLLFIIGKVVYNSDKTKDSNIAFLLLASSLSCWSLVIFNSSIHPFNSRIITIDSWFSFVFVSMIAFSLLLFSATLWENKNIFTKKNILLFSFVPLFWTIISFSKKIVITAYTFSPYTADYGSFFGIFNIYFLVLILSSFTLLISKAIKHPKHRNEILFIFFGLALTISTGGILLLLLPMFNVVNYADLTYLMPSVMVIVLGYSLLRFQHFDLVNILKKETLINLFRAFYSAIILLLVYGLSTAIGIPKNLMTWVLLLSIITVVYSSYSLSNKIEFLFYQDRLRFKNAILRISNQLTAFPDYPHMIKRIQELAQEIFKPTNITILKHVGLNQYLEIETHEQIEITESTIEDSSIILKNQTRFPEFFHKNDCDIVLDIKLSNKSLALLGMKLDQTYLNYTDENFELLEIFAKEIAIALGYATEFEKSQQQQAQLFQAEKLSALGQLVSGIAHELRNPMAGITLSLDNIQNTPTPEELNKNINRSFENIERVNELIDNLLEYSRKSELNIAKISIPTLLEKSLFFVLKQAKQNNIKIETTIDSELETVQADAKKMQQVIMNLVLNAIQAIGKEGQITITFKKQPSKKTAIEIKDSGPGISADKLTTIFDPFYTTKDTGTGLGLAICKEIVEQHNGTITAQSTLGHGTTFTIVLPN